MEKNVIVGGIWTRADSTFAAEVGASSLRLVGVAATVREFPEHGFVLAAIAPPAVNEDGR